MRPWNDLLIAPLYLGIMLLFSALVLPVATTWVRSDADAIVGTALWGGMIVVVALVATSTKHAPRVIPLGAAVLLAAFLMGIVAMSLQVWLLDTRGEQHHATVVTVYDKHSAPATYDLAVDGAPIPGRLSAWPGTGQGAVGDLVVVVQDPDGLIDPRLPAELAGDVEDDPRILILPIIGILAVLCLAAVWPKRQKETPRPRRTREPQI